VKASKRWWYAKDQSGGEIRRGFKRRETGTNPSHVFKEGRVENRHRGRGKQGPPIRHHSKEIQLK